jgi:hypothetical protein
MADTTEFNEKTKENPLFLGLVGNLQVSAVIHLGKLADPISGETKRDLSAAKASIDLLRMLREKTHGNLTEGERRVLDHTIFELELNYVEESSREEREPKAAVAEPEDAGDENAAAESHQSPG